MKNFLQKCYNIIKRPILLYPLITIIAILAYSNQKDAKVSLAGSTKFEIYYSADCQSCSEQITQIQNNPANKDLIKDITFTKIEGNTAITAYNKRLSDCKVVAPTGTNAFMLYTNSKCYTDPTEIANVLADYISKFVTPTPTASVTPTATPSITVTPTPSTSVSPTPSTTATTTVTPTGKSLEQTIKRTAPKISPLTLILSLAIPAVLLAIGYILIKKLRV